MSQSTISLIVFLTWLILGLSLLRRGIPLGTVIFAAGVGISLALGRGIPGFFADSLEVTFDPQVIELLAIVTLIYLLSFLLKATHHMERIAHLLKDRLKDARLVLIAVPALVGLIPMPGGAMFTAPITDEVGKEIDLSPEDKVFSNYWFRHCWEFAFPLYPGIILSAGLLKMSPLDLAANFLPLAGVAFLGGIILSFFRWKKPRGIACSEQPSGNTSLAFESEKPGYGTLWPVIAVILLALFNVSLPIGLLLINVLFAVTKKVGFFEFLKHFRDSFNGGVILLIWAVFFFGKTLSSTGLVTTLGNFFIGIGMPLWLLNFLFPFLFGALTGSTPGFIGPTFPMLIPLWGEHRLEWLQFAYSAGLAGVFISPSHLCLSLTQDYFKADLLKTIRLIFFPVILVMSLAAFRLGFLR